MYIVEIKIISASITLLSFLLLACWPISNSIFIHSWPSPFLLLTPLFQPSLRRKLMGFGDTVPTFPRSKECCVVTTDRRYCQHIHQPYQIENLDRGGQGPASSLLPIELPMENQNYLAHPPGRLVIQTMITSRKESTLRRNFCSSHSQSQNNKSMRHKCPYPMSSIP